jgi:2-polyprenyl-3-methyl-5-hydroxy-6-metoxy-1,4-benzoquinol methylase
MCINLKFKTLRLLRKLFLASIRILRTVENSIWLRERNLTFDSELIQNRRVVTSTEYDMSSEPGEDYYARQYLRAVDRLSIDVSAQLKIVDFGCGQGRLTVPIAQKFRNSGVTGVDLSEEALQIAKVNSTIAGLGNVSFLHSAIGDYLSTLENSSFDLALFTEVAFFLPGWEEVISSVFHKLAPGGVLIASFRSTYFTLMLQLRANNFLSAIEILQSNEGRVTPHDDLIFTWVDSDDLVDFCVQQGMDVVEVFGIGTSSGIRGDMLDGFAQPGNLREEQLSILEVIEEKYASLLPDVGRYIAIVVKKPLILE